MMKKTILFLAIFTSVVSCSDGVTPAERTNGFSTQSNTKEDSLFQSVMEDHDAAMAKMGKLTGLRKQVSQKLDSLTKAAASANGSWVVSLKEVQDKLTSAEEHMNDWMEGFSIDSAKNDQDKRVIYLQSEKTKVSIIRNELLGSVAEADSLLKK